MENNTKYNFCIFNILRRGLRKKQKLDHCKSYRIYGISTIAMADKNKAVNNTDKKRLLSGSFRSFSNMVRRPKKKGNI